MEQIGFTPRLLDVKGLMQYTSLGRNNAMELGKKAEAVKRYGARVLYDRLKIDSYIDRMEAMK